MNSTVGGLSSSSLLLSFESSEFGLALGKLKGATLLEKKPLGVGIFVSLAGLLKDVNTDVVGLSSFTLKVNPLDFGGELTVPEATAGESASPKKKPVFGASSLLATGGLIPKLKMFAGEVVLDVASDLVGVVLGLGTLPNEKNGAVIVVVGPPLVTVQLDVLPNCKDDEGKSVAVVVVGLPKQKPLAVGAADVAVSAAVIVVAVGGVGVAVVAVISVAFDGVFAEFPLASSFCRSSFAYLS